MCDIETFKIDLKGLKEGETLIEYSLNDDFFEAIEASEVRRGELKVELSVRRTSSFFELNFHTKGFVYVPCDLCLDDVEQSIDTQDRLIVKFGEEYSEEDNQVTVEENKGILDTSWFIYEFIVLNIPIKHVHAPGNCNAAMIDVLNQHTATRSGEGDMEETVDPRWMKLKEIKNNIKD